MYHPEHEPENHPRNQLNDTWFFTQPDYLKNASQQLLYNNQQFLLNFSPSNTGPVSAPALLAPAEDYFSIPTEFDSDAHTYLQPRKVPLLKIQHKSHLSHSYTHGEDEHGSHGLRGHDLLHHQDQVENNHIANHDSLHGGVHQHIHRNDKSQNDLLHKNNHVHHEDHLHHNNHHKDNLHDNFLHEGHHHDSHHHAGNHHTFQHHQNSGSHGPLSQDSHHQEYPHQPPRDVLKSKPKKKPGFRLHLDELLHRNTPSYTQSSHSDGAFDLTNDNMRLHNQKLYTPDINRNELAQENITPLMNPPDTMNGYFDSLESGSNIESLLAFGENLPGGYFEPPESNNSVTSDTDLEVHPYYVDENINYSRPEDFRLASGDGHLDPEPFDATPFFLGIHELGVSERPELERSILAPGATQNNFGPLTLTEKVFAKRKKTPKGSVCSICDRYISRDFSRHMRIHDEVGRFRCVFPREQCKHKLGKFNRPYDYKKHLLNMHFRFDNPAVKMAPNLTEKTKEMGLCIACGQRFIGNDWLDDHILSPDVRKKCQELLRTGNSNYRNIGPIDSE